MFFLLEVSHLRPIARAAAVLVMLSACTSANPGVQPGLPDTPSGDLAKPIEDPAIAYEPRIVPESPDKDVQSAFAIAESRIRVHLQSSWRKRKLDFKLLMGIRKEGDLPLSKDLCKGLSSRVLVCQPGHDRACGWSDPGTNVVFCNSDWLSHVKALVCGEEPVDQMACRDRLVPLATFVLGHEVTHLERQRPRGIDKKAICRHYFAHNYFARLRQPISSFRAEIEADRRAFDIVRSTIPEGLRPRLLEDFEKIALDLHAEAGARDQFASSHPPWVDRALNLYKWSEVPVSGRVEGEHREVVQRAEKWCQRGR